jgi:hypothetical protein
MRPIVLDFAPKSRRPNASALVLLCIGIASALGGSTYWFATLERSRELERELAVLAAAQRPRTEPAQPALTLEQLAALRAAIEHLNVPMPSLLRALQPPPGAGVSLLGLEFNAGSERGTGSGFRLTARADTLAPMLAYVERLGQSPMFASVQLARHEYAQPPAARGVQFVAHVTLRSPHAN